MKYNFDEIIDRSASHCVKIDRLKAVFGRDDLIPLWVADMDFLSPPAIAEALIERTRHGIFGYTVPDNGYYNSIIDWLRQRHSYEVRREEITFVPGVVKGIAFAIDAFTRKNDKIIIQPPVYHPFRIVPESLGREVINNPLLFDNGRYSIDFDGLRRIVAENECKILLLCSPHNPAGRVWHEDELKQLAEICYDNNILVISDEIHSDLTLPGYRHRPFATVSEKARKNSITLMAPSKTFNIAGIVSSFAVTHNPEIRKQYLGYLSPRELDQPTIHALVATEAAYREGREWLDEAIAYIQKNITFVESFLKEHIPQIKVIRPEATFLLWLDCRELHLTQKELVYLFVHKAGLALNNGTIFGKEGEGFMRLNVGTTLSTLEKALDKLRKAING
ncbi:MULTISPECIES: MalY/PatB family protein [Petrimonas]|jgi:cystathionine beta-lyase|uniref:cysteine-S-conjugate beta-lyase n=1 Tax=Petrimonas mucosa TaxID=1642646 RepID=A0A1G4G975_9BACT|nr:MULTISPECIES: MalY/PatB family protein [Petrimonas]MDD3561710.1 pyridoxal phosphate-dependent aminotransferase [Petrimonas mucosa]SCM59087.1 Cystathionine beta-lyase PatB [Petrimonas mucosa]HHT30186.1 pyridoxal phosphate-dependent aminotransferase [Petrimonas mucosa]